MENTNKKKKWKKATLPEFCMAPYSCSANKLYLYDENGSALFIPRKLCKFQKKNNQWAVLYLPHFDFARKLEEVSKKWEENDIRLAAYDKLGAMVDWDDEILQAYEAERAAAEDKQAVDTAYFKRYS